MNPLTQRFSERNDADYALSAIDKDTWTLVNQLHVKKCIAELAHERIITPLLLSEDNHEAQEWGCYQLDADESGISYVFKAKKLALDHWFIDSETIEKRKNDEWVPLDSLLFIIEFRKSLDIAEANLATYLEEISSTLYSSAYKYTKISFSSAELVNADLQKIESAMNEGHPSFIANNGRIGFDAIDYHHYSPEAGEEVELIYLAAKKDKVFFSSIEELSYQKLIHNELDTDIREKFEQRLVELGHSNENFIFIPIHPWQWYNKVVNVFSSDLAVGDLIYLGRSSDQYLAQQSIRTMYNNTVPQRHYVKTALSILNMGYIRGLFAHDMSSLPKINDWLYGVVSNDEYLNQKNFYMLREVAAVGYKSCVYNYDFKDSSPYKKMLSALWRESPAHLIETDEKALTMAALLHVDVKGDALLPLIIEDSPLELEEWLTHYLDVYLAPLLHCFYQHKLVFMPHGENIILVMKNNIPVKCIMKDTGEEAYLLNSDLELDEPVSKLSIALPEELEILSIFIDVFDGFFRHLTAILFEHMNVKDDYFWSLVANCIREYQSKFPELSSRFEKHDIFKTDFSLSCLNRLQLRNNFEMVSLTDPAEALQFQGKLKNPLAKFK
ncbi:IucA/IucC family protein [Shewanella surugensis]|uniref:IucA/IucC family siderophore biosynthesis protein n=1 Tax=Shewanella surugensis TaxID=212020 RepID=A0ABT0LCL1_9GAMM|nr:IucA/IucC family siderophore biosynthesis protein [Shewanella surugensis]MCL1125413.1 IucA/IucC family siderophore biosynthesis protein [Shewanella surugensis]